jgi:tripartite-type tricarboxylate transporter receptor subunit TctC
VPSLEFPQADFRVDHLSAEALRPDADDEHPASAHSALRRCFLLGGASIPFWFISRKSAAQPGRYPDHPIRFVSPSPAGGTGDLLLRLIGPQLSEVLGQPIIVENKPGAGGRIALDQVVKSASDGYTLFLATNATTLAAPTGSAAGGSDLRRSFLPVTKIASIPVVIAVSPTLGVSTLSELIDRARRDPDRLAYASSGVGSTSHLAADLLFRRAAVKLLHVPYPGTAFAVKDVLSGEVPVIFTYPATVAAHLRSGQLRALAMTSAHRLAAFADIPTVAESGYPGFAIATWFGVLVPIGTSPEIVRRLHAALVQVVALAEFRERLANLGMQPIGNSPAAFAAELDDDYRHRGTMVPDSTTGNE